MSKMTENQKTEKYGPVIARMNSTRDTSKVYEVRLLNGHYSCTCKGWIFNKKCRHTIYAEENGLCDAASKADVHLQFELYVIDDILKAGSLTNVNGRARGRM